MKLKLLIVLSFLAYHLSGQVSTAATAPVKINNPNYDAELAQRLGSDQYGMKSYFLVILKTGTNQTGDKDFINTSFKGHMDNIKRLVDAGNLIVAGPLGKNALQYRGIFIINNVDTEDAVKELLRTDPAIEGGLLDYEILEWYGSAALPEYLPASEKIWQVSH